MIRDIEERLGSEGSYEQAESMFNLLKARGRISYSGFRGYEMEELDENDWNAYLVEVEA